MLVIKHILFPIYFSERTCGAAPFVDAMASRFGAEVTVMSVATLIWYYGMGEPGAPVFMDTDALKDDLKNRLDASFANEVSHLQVNRIAEVGDPAETISQYARTQGVDLIMMPTH